MCVTRRKAFVRTLQPPAGTTSGVAEAGAAGKLLIDISTTEAEATKDMAARLIELTKSKDERVRLGDIQTALDRGWGKAVQHTEAEISVYDSLSLDEQQALLAILESLDADDEEGASGGSAPTHH